jgi:hypothetical protein
MDADRRFALAAGAGVALILASGLSDFVVGTFWERHTLLASLVANLLVVAVTVVVVNEMLERRDRRRWNLLAQSVLFALLQSARATWTGLVEVLGLAEVQSGAVEPLRSAAGLARDAERVSHAARGLLEDAERRASLQRMCVALSEHASAVIARWAPVMVGAGPYAEMFDRHVELASRLEWLSSVLAHNEPVSGRSVRDRALTRSSVATEHAVELGNDDWLHDQLLAVIRLATDLDQESRESAYSLVPLSWWAERTAGLTGGAPVPVEPEQPNDEFPGR